MLHWIRACWDDLLDPEFREQDGPHPMALKSHHPIRTLGFGEDAKFHRDGGPCPVVCTRLSLRVGTGDVSLDERRGSAGGEGTLPFSGLLNLALSRVRANRKSHLIPSSGVVAGDGSLAWDLSCAAAGKHSTNGRTGQWLGEAL